MPFIAKSVSETVDEYVAQQLVNGRSRAGYRRWSSSRVTSTQRCHLRLHLYSLQRHALHAQHAWRRDYCNISYVQQPYGSLIFLYTTTSTRSPLPMAFAAASAVFPPPTSKAVTAVVILITLFVAVAYIIVASICYRRIKQPPWAKSRFSELGRQRYVLGAFPANDS